MTPDSENVTFERLNSQYKWYNDKAKSNQTWFKLLKLTQIVVAAAIPVAATLGASATAAGVMGAVILVVESVQQLFQYQQNWVSYRSTAEALLAESHLYKAGAGPYAGVPAPALLLADRVEALLSKERSGWVAGQLSPGADKERQGTGAIVAPAEPGAAEGNGTQKTGLTRAGDSGQPDPVGGDPEGNPQDSA
jgi:hypothetical protein